MNGMEDHSIQVYKPPIRSSEVLDVSSPDSSWIPIDCSVGKNTVKLFLSSGETSIKWIIDMQNIVWSVCTTDYAKAVIAHYKDGKPTRVMAGFKYMCKNPFETFSKGSNGKWQTLGELKYGEFPDGSKPGPPSLIPFSINISSSKNGCMGSPEPTDINISENTLDGIKARIFTPKYGYNANALMDGSAIIWKTQKEGTGGFCGFFKNKAERIVYVKVYPADDPKLLSMTRVNTNGYFKESYYGKNDDQWSSLDELGYTTKLKELRIAHKGILNITI